MHQFLPDIAAWKVCRELAARGFPDARFRVEELELDRLVLADVELAPGLTLETAELDAGVSLLWRDVDEVVVRGARFQRDAIWQAATSSGELAFRTLRIEDGVVAQGSATARITGTIDVSSSEPSARLVVRSSAWPIGSHTLLDPVVHVDGNRACGAAILESFELEACTTLTTWDPTSLALTWDARRRDVKARGRTTVEWSPRAALRDGYVEAALARTGHGATTVEDVTVAAEFAGDPDAITAKGLLGAKRMRDDSFTLVDLEVPFRAHVRDSNGWRIETESTVVHARTLDAPSLRAAGVSLKVGSVVIGNQSDYLPLKWSAKRVLVAKATLVDVSGTLERDRSLTWRARELIAGPLRISRPSGRVIAGRAARHEHELSWVEGRVGPLVFGAGALTLGVDGERRVFRRGSVAAYGGQISFARECTPTDVVLDVRGIQLGTVLRSLSNAVIGRGVLDGAIAVRNGEIERAHLQTRGVGTFEIGDRRWVDRAVADIAAGQLAVAQRIRGALVDFEYKQLGVEWVATPAGPALRVHVRGVGRLVRQELDLNFNVRGLREAIRFLARTQEAS